MHSEATADRPGGLDAGQACDGGGVVRLAVVTLAVGIPLDAWGAWWAQPAVSAWSWAVEPRFGLTTTNPPVWIGAVYCTLETLVRLVARRRGTAGFRLAESGAPRYCEGRQPWVLAHRTRKGTTHGPAAHAA